jgi:hypothetical protein
VLRFTLRPCAPAGSVAPDAYGKIFKISPKYPLVGGVEEEDEVFHDVEGFGVLDVGLGEPVDEGGVEVFVVDFGEGFLIEVVFFEALEGVFFEEIEMVGVEGEFLLSVLFVAGLDPESFA